MPVNRVLRQTNRQGDYRRSSRVRIILENGFDFEWLDDALGPQGKLDPALLLDTWREQGEKIMAEWIGKNPGTRPFAWWYFEAREPRRQLNPGPKPIGPSLWFGKPSLYESMPPDDMYETEAEYLGRHGLLGRQERLSLEIKNGH